MRTFYLILFFFLVSHSLLSQTKKRVRVDTIFSETAEKTYVYVVGDIRFIDVGSGKRDFSVNFAVNCAIIKAVHDQALPTSIHIDYGDGFYHGTLAYVKKCTEEQKIVDFRDKQDSIPAIAEEARVITKKDDEVDKSIVVERLGRLAGDPREKIKTVVKLDAGLKFSLFDLRKDDQFLYVKVGLENKSRSPYKIDRFTFGYLDVGLNTEKTGKVPHYVNIQRFFYPASVELKEKKYCVFAIPYMSLGKSGELEITMMEKDGTRTMVLTVDADRIIDAQKF